MCPPACPPILAAGGTHARVRRGRRVASQGGPRTCCAGARKPAVAPRSAESDVLAHGEHTCDEVACYMLHCVNLAKLELRLRIKLLT